jgi:POTRA domain-containing FtsQ-type protein
MRAGYRSAQRFRAPERRRRHRRILAAAALLAFAAAAAPRLGGPTARWLGKLPPFQVRHVDVSGCVALAPDDVRASLPVSPGDNLLLLDPRRLADAARRNPRVGDVRVSRAPGTLHVRVYERHTFLLLLAGALLECDSTGVILPALRGGSVPDRPVVTGLSLPTRRAGARITTARLRDVLRLASDLEAPDVGLLPEISEIAARDPREITLRTSRDQIPIFIDPLRTTHASLRALAVSLRDVRERHRPVLSMDARFRGQVVVRCASDSLRAAPERRDKV